ncbi:response regulator transcription factor [Nitrospira sp. NS4]|uniref:response regulator transcription factor n=1 Tax=Nitrospira sp. NS4 TaxID=3414498 RepID=UPI003C2EC1B9
MVTILLIDDNEQVRTLFRRNLENAGYCVLLAASGSEGWRLLHEEIVDLILVRVFLPDIDGLEFVHRLRKTRPACKIIAMLGGSGEWSYHDAVKLLGANDILKQPLSLQELLETVSAQVNRDTYNAAPHDMDETGAKPCEMDCAALRRESMQGQACREGEHDQGRK